MAIKLEVGKKYELNNGEVHECTKMYGDDPLAVNDFGCGPFVLNGCFYHQDGTFAYRAATQKYSGVKRCVDDYPKLWRDMTPEEKGALLLAHHEGKVIEWNAISTITGEFTGWDKCDDDCLWDDTHLGEGFAYRVKPEPVAETVAIEGGCYSGVWRLSQSGFIGDHTHRITFDVIDGVPDCSSVKMEKL